MRRTIAPTVLAAALLVGAAVAAITPSTASKFSATITNSTDTVSTDNYFQCSAVFGSSVDGANALFVWPLTESSGTTAADSSGHGNTGTYVGTIASDTAASPVKACPRDSGSPLVFDGSTTYAYLGTQQTNPTTFSLEVWFKTTQAGGKLIGFGSSSTGSSGNYDRHIYLDTSGRLVFGIYNGAIRTIQSTASYNDGKWHQVIATLAPSGTYAGMTLYVDGAQVAANSTANYLTPQNFNGYWRVGYDNLNSWLNQGSVYYFKGSMRYAAVFSTVLTPAQVAREYGAGAGS